MMMIFGFSSWTTFIECASLGEDSQHAPPYTKMGEAPFGISSLGLYLDDNHKDAILHELQRIFLSIHAHGERP